MANTVKMKRSAVPGKVPATTDLDLGEIAINTYDGKAYIKKNVSGTESIVPLGGAGSGDVTGPNSSTDNAIARFDGASGKIIQNSTGVIDDSGNASLASLSLTTDLAVTHGGTGASDAAGARTNLGLGTISTQNANAVSITGGSINGTAIGATTASTGKFTTLEATGVSTFAAGTNTAPSITTAGDTNTGIFFPAADTIAFTEGGVEAMRINSSGNVGIGATSPVKKLTTLGDIGIGYGNALCFTDGDSRTFTADKAIYNYWDGGADRLQIQPSGSSSGIITFNAGAPATTRTERMRIDAGGNVWIGPYATTNTSAGVLIVPDNGGGVGYINVSHTSQDTGGNSYLSFVRNAVAVGSITSSGTTNVAYNTSSDYRLKENIQPMQDALAVVQQLNPVTYTWKSDGSDGQGFIAHELQAVVPDCVTGEKDAVDKDGNPVYQGIDTSFLVATLTAAIKELKAELDATKAEVSALKEA